MVIKASSRQQVEALLGQLGALDALARETAITRLTVIGARALDPVMALACSHAAAPSDRMAALKVLEGLADPRSFAMILQAIDDADDGVASAAASAARGFLRGPQGAEAVDRLTAIVLGSTRADTVRLAALGTLSDLGAAALRPIYAALVNDSSEAIAGLALRPTRTRAEEAADLVATALQSDPVNDPASLMRSLAEAGSVLSLTTLHAVVERAAECEVRGPSSTRAAWTGVRGLAHATLAGRGSRLALYDLRETIAKTSAPLPTEFLSALRHIADASCLEAIASGMSRASDPWWRGELVELFRVVAARERISRRHAVGKRIEKRWPEVSAVVWAQPQPSTTSRTKPR